MSSEYLETSVEPEPSDQDSQPGGGALEYQGPLPPPSVLGAYDQISPGAADKMINEWQHDRQHQRKLQTESIDVYKNNSRWSPICRLATIIVVVAGGFQSS